MRLSEISLEQRRVMLAERDGIERIYSTALPVKVISCDVPNYAESLDACNRLEEKLTDEECVRYQQRLTELIASDVFEADDELPYPAFEYWFHASASQRSEALLLTLYPEVTL